VGERLDIPGVGLAVVGTVAGEWEGWLLTATFDLAENLSGLLLDGQGCRLACRYRRTGFGILLTHSPLVLAAIGEFHCDLKPELGELSLGVERSHAHNVGQFPPLPRS
jgi:hypothetical protein